MKSFIHYLCLATLFLSISSAAAISQIRNIIIMISDGCGYNHIETTDYYQYGEVGLQVYENFPTVVAVSTYSETAVSYISTSAWQRFEYVIDPYTDSAASATAMSTGVKTINEQIGIGATCDSLTHLIDYAEDMGKATGVVTSMLWSHATPAGFMAHNIIRTNYTQIAQEIILDSRVDVVMGCGHPWYDNDGDSTSIPNYYEAVGNRFMWAGLVAGQTGFDPDSIGMVTDWVSDANGDNIIDPWTLVQTRDEFRALMERDTPSRVMGTAQVWASLHYCRRGSGTEPPFTYPLNETVPTLGEMTLGAINVIDDDPEGFLLVVEGGAVDWASHSNCIGRMIEEEIMFNNAVDTVVAWIEANSNWEETLLIVTADHETGYLNGPGSGSGPPPVWNPIVSHGAGEVPIYQWYSYDHTNSLVPLFAKGAGSELLLTYADEYDSVRGDYIDNTEIFTLVDELWNLTGGEQSGLEPVTSSYNQVEDYLLLSIYPNPFNPSSIISYELSVNSKVNLAVYDISGQRVAELVDGWRNAGENEVTFDGSDLASGIYIYRLSAGEFSASGKMVLIK